MNKATKLARSESGASLVEFAIVAPVLISLLVGLIEVGRYTYIAILAANAARAGVSFGAQNLVNAANASAMQSAALADAQSFPSMSASPTVFCSADGTTVVSCPPTTSPSPTYYYVEVTTTGTFKSLFNYPGIPNNIPITGQAIMRVINQQ
jgi:Flp pilus assembly protein TadG